MSEKRYSEQDVRNIISMVCDHFNQAFVGRDEFIDLTIETYAPALHPSESAVWVKATIYKPQQKSEYRPYRKKDAHNGYDYGEIYVTTDGDDVFFDIEHENEYNPQSDERWMEFEILDESAARSEKEEAVAPLTDEELQFMRECNVYPHANGTAKILTEQDEGAHIFPEDLLKLADVLYRYVKTEQPK